MTERHALQSHLQNMERAAERALQGDSAFYEALQALKYEIDSDSRVRTAIRNLRAAGRQVFSSFVPYVRIRIRTNEGILALSRQTENQPHSTELASLIQELRNAASDVIMKSRHRLELDSIVNEAVGASASFEGIASEIEEAGHEVLICLDLSTYAQVRETPVPSRQLLLPTGLNTSQEPLDRMLSDRDFKFLKALKIKT